MNRKKRIISLEKDLCKLIELMVKFVDDTNIQIKKIEGLLALMADEKIKEYLDEKIEELGKDKTIQ